MFGLDKSYIWLLGRPFDLYTDHHALTFMMSSGQLIARFKTGCTSSNCFSRRFISLMGNQMSVLTFYLALFLLALIVGLVRCPPLPARTICSWRSFVGPRS